MYPGGGVENFVGDPPPPLHFKFFSTHPHYKFQMRYFNVFYSFNSWPLLHISIFELNGGDAF